MTFNNKNHWYDGLFYEKIISKNQDSIFEKIGKLIAQESNVLDVGCATGRFEQLMASKCKSIMGIDISLKNIDRANKILAKNPKDNVEFLHTDIDSLLSCKSEKFDYAVLTYVIHEVPPAERVDLLNKIAKISNKIIIGEYLVPRPHGIRKLLNTIVEYLAGTDHFNSFRDFVLNNGVTGLAQKAGFKITYEERDTISANHIAQLEKLI